MVGSASLKSVSPMTTPQWFALTVCPHHEKQVANILRAKQVRYCLPLYASLRRWKDRRKQVDMVLFPGYVFVNVVLRDRLAVLTVPGVVRFINFQGRPAVVPDQEITAIQIGSAAGVDVQPHPYLQKGQRVRVKAGPLVDTEGILVRRKGHFRMVISVNSLMRSLSVQVDECDIAPL